MTMVDFAEAFARLKAAGRTEETTQCDGVAVRLVRVAGGGEGQWGSHGDTTETVIVWSGDFTWVRDSAAWCPLMPSTAAHPKRGRRSSCSRTADPTPPRDPGKRNLGGG